MRLDSMQKQALNKALENVDGAVYLYGSRVEDSKKGGDIDILVFSKQNSFRLSQDIAVKFFMECEEKIDVTVMNPHKLSPEQQAFLNVIKTERLK